MYTYDTLCSYIHVCVCARARVCVCVCVCVRESVCVRVLTRLLLEPYESLKRA